MDSPQWGFYALVRPQEVDIELVFTTKCCLLDHFDELVASFWHGIIFSPFSFLIRFLSSLFSERCLVKSFSSIQLYERNLKLIQRSRESVQVLISLRSDGTFYYFHFYHMKNLHFLYFLFERCRIMEKMITHLQPFYGCFQENKFSENHEEKHHYYI